MDDKLGILSKNGSEQSLFHSESSAESESMQKADLDGLIWIYQTFTRYFYGFLLAA
jgi:hypothetical protein